MISLYLAFKQLCINTMRSIMSLVVLDHMRGLGISINDILYIYTPKRSRIPHEWYLSPRLGMSNFITGNPSTNKDLNRSLVAISGKWEFGITESEGLPKVSRVHGSAGKFFFICMELPYLSKIFSSFPLFIVSIDIVFSF